MTRNDPFLGVLAALAALVRFGAARWTHEGGRLALTLRNGACFELDAHGVRRAPAWRVQEGPPGGSARQRV